ncbi:unnamed protein product, partial [Didymodactylos carnosus]
ISVEELNQILNESPKLDELPEYIESDTVYRLYLNEETKGDYIVDAYTWKNRGTVSWPKHENKFKKTWFTCFNHDGVVDKRFVKHIYVSNSNKYDVIVVYIGNKTIAKTGPHGNAKSAVAHGYRRTKPSIVTQIKNSVKSSTEANAYKTLVGTAVTDPPRDVAQVRYYRQKFLQDQRVTYDEMLNLMILSNELKNYIRVLNFKPQLIVVFEHIEAEKLFAQLLTLTNELIPLYYDTTFEIGDYYVSILTYSHRLFVEQPIIPLCILIHDTKEQTAHDELAKILKKHKSIEQKCLLITDGEFALQNAFTDIFPSLKLLRCHNHFNNNIKEWLRDHFNVLHRGVVNQSKSQTTTTTNVGLTAMSPLSPITATTSSTMSPNESQNNFYKTYKTEFIRQHLDDVYNLLRCGSKAEFLDQYREKKQQWTPKFVTYFETYHLPHIDHF